MGIRHKKINEKIEVLVPNQAFTTWNCVYSAIIDIICSDTNILLNHINNNIVDLFDNISSALVSITTNIISHRYNKISLTACVLPVFKRLLKVIITALIPSGTHFTKHRSKTIC